MMDEQQQTDAPKTNQTTASVDQSEDLNTKNEIKLNFLLMGKTGQGKSATGNTLIKRRGFKTSTNSNSETKDVNNHFSQFGKCELKVVDGPGLEDTDLNNVEDKDIAAKNMDTALAMCNGGVDAFIFVLKFPFRFTEEERQCLNGLKSIFGEMFFSHVIVVMTGGDTFPDAMEEEGRNINFKEWCTQQEGAGFIELYTKCDGRFVLFNNREKNEERNNEQIQELVDITILLKDRSGRYTSQCFERAKYEREKLIVELKAPQLQEEFQKHMSLLTAEIEELAKEPSEPFKMKVRDRVKQLRSEIEKKDKGFGVLKDLRKKIDQVQDHLNDKEKLIALSKELEKTRQCKKGWGLLGKVCVVGGAVLAVVAAPAAVVAASVGALVCDLGYMKEPAKEDNIKQQQKTHRRRKKAGGIEF